MKRWIDLSEYGMRLLIAVHPKGRFLILEGGDRDEKAAKALGFVRRPTGTWVRVGSVDVNPREFLRILPKAALKEMPESEYVITPEPAKQVEAQPASDGAVPATPQDGGAAFVGVNRFGQEVHQTGKRRYAIDSRGRRTFEDQIAAPMPGVFLRAVDAGSLAMCAEGYLEQWQASERHGRPDPSRFLELIASKGFAVTPGDFAEAVSDAASRMLMKKGDLSLRDRFGKAAAIEGGLGSVAGRRHPGLPLSIALRRMMGTDVEMLGQSVAFRGGNTSLVSGLVPRGARLADGYSAADITVDFEGGSADEIMDRLSTRQAAARSFVFLPSDEGLHGIAKRYHIESAGRLGEKVGGPGILVSVGSRLDAVAEDAVVPFVRDVDSHAELWTWATDVSVHRNRVQEALKSGLATEADLNAADPSLLRNDFQVPYASASQVDKPTTMVPKDLDGPSRQALDRAVSAYGDIDRKVSVEFGIPGDRLGKALAPEQIDALALYLNAEERGRDAFLIADGAGVGKGRTVCSIASRSVMQGRRVVLATEREINLSDLMRDLKHLGFGDSVRVGVMNDGAALIDEATGESFRVAGQAAMKAAVASGEWPEGVDIVLTTYSQFNRAEEESARVRWLKKVMRDNGQEIDLVLDESHNAAGTSTTAMNFAEASANARSVVFSSATFAATPEQMGSYERLFPEGISAEEIVGMMKKGGELFQEVVTAMLVADGVMVRREQDLSQIQFNQVVDDARTQRNRVYMDQLASIITEMASLSGEIDAWVERRNEENERTGVKGLQMTRMGFGSPLYTMVRLFSASLLTELSAERAVDALRNGKKPVILVENTIQGIMDEAAAGDGAMPDFRAVVHRILDQMTSVRSVDAIGIEDRIDVDADDAGVAGSVARIREMIDGLPILPASAIDDVRLRIEAAGFSCGEITGRSHEIRDGKVVPRKNRNRIKTKNDFNAGRLDALIINPAGATGIDLHAGERFEDQSQRVLVVHQGPSYVNREIQALFRIFRRGQTSNPIVEFLSSGLPAEMRLAAMRNRKLSRLTANTSSNRDSVFLARDIPDIINPVGDTVISRYAEMRPDLLRRLHLVDDEADEEVNPPANDNQGNEAEEGKAERDADYSANLFLSRLSLLPTEAQLKIIEELTNEYQAHIAELEAKGENPLRAKELNGIVHVRHTRVFEGGSQHSGDTVFDGALHLSEVMIERVAEPIRADQVVEAVERGAAMHGRVVTALSNLDEHRDVFLEPFLPKRARTVDEALAQGSRKINLMAQQISDLVDALNQIVPGREVPFPYGEEGSRAIVTSIEAPTAGFEHIPSMYQVELAVPGALTMHRFRLDTLLRTPGFCRRKDDGSLAIDVTQGLDGSDYDRVLDDFENAKGRKMTSGRMLTGNMVRAVLLAAKHSLGSVVSFVDQNGVSHRGVLVRKDFERKLDDLALRIDGIEAALSALTELRAEINTLPGAPDRALVITPLGIESWTVRMPGPSRRKGGQTWPSDAYREMHSRGQIDAKGRSRVTVTGAEELRSALEMFAEAGIATYYASAKHRARLEMVNVAEPARRVA